MAATLLASHGCSDDQPGSEGSDLGGEDDAGRDTSRDDIAIDGPADSAGGDGATEDTDAADDGAGNDDSSPSDTGDDQGGADVDPGDTSTEEPDAGDTADGGDAGDARAAWVRQEITSHNADLDEDIRADKYEKMEESAFAFFRGSNHLFWADLGEDDRLGEYGSASTVAFLLGDAHTENYGAFHNDEGDIVYDFNDFDEAFLADYQLDVWRMATGLVLVGRQNELSAGDIQAGVDAFVEAYLDAIEDYAAGDLEADVTFTAANSSGPLDNFLVDVADSESRDELLDRWTIEVDGDRVFNPAEEELAAIDDTLRDDIIEALVDYGDTLSGGLDWDVDYFAVKDVAQRLNQGIGSLGVRRYYVLIEGPSDASDDDIILDVKEQRIPTGAAYMPDGIDLDALFTSPAQRVVRAQRAMVTNADDHLGWLFLGVVSFSVRERSPWDETFDVAELTDVDDLSEMAEQWGIIMAADQSRADEDFDADVIAYSVDDAIFAEIDGNHDEIRALVWQVASTYADQVELDYQVFLAMIR